MPVTVSYPGIYIEELPASAHTITAAPTSITVFVGYTHPFEGECAELGQWGNAIRIFNFTEFERIFGGFFRTEGLVGDVAHAVNQFFLNGGSDAYVVGLQPKIYTYDSSGDIVLPGTAISGASTTAFGGIRFTAKQLTDRTSKMSIAIRNLRDGAGSASGTNDVADIIVAYGLRVETFRGVRLKTGNPSDYMDPTDTAQYLPDFIGNRLAPSRLVAVEPAVGGAYPARYAIPSSQPVVLADTPFPTSGNWTMFLASDFLDVFKDDHPLDKVDVFNLLVIPAVADASVWAVALSFCERKRAFYILDPPPNYTADGMGMGLPKIDELLGTGSDAVPTAVPNGALYFPYLTSLDPVTNNPVALPPSGFVAGVYARTDNHRGVWKAPAGLETSILSATGVVDEGRMTDMRQGTLNPLGINVLRTFPGSGTVIWGARTLVTNNSALQQWRYVPVRRMALFIEQTLYRNLGWVVFEPNDQPLWTAIRLSVDGFMLSLFRKGAFQGATPSQAFQVKCDEVTTTQTDIDNGIVNIVVGFRPLKPAEFVVVKIAQLAGQVQA
jgi:uncharacterized protein